MAKRSYLIDPNNSLLGKLLFSEVGLMEWRKWWMIFWGSRRHRN